MEIESRSVSGRLTVQEGQLEENSIYLESLERSVRTIGGTVVVCEEGVAMAEVGWMAFRNSPNSRNLLDNTYLPPATIIIKNGGPSTPATAHNSQLWGGPWVLRHDVDGHLPPDPSYMFGVSSWAFTSDVVYYDPIGTGISRLLPGTEPSWHKSVQKDADILAAFTEWYMRKIAPAESPLILAGSSFDAVRTPLTALNLEERDIATAGLFMLSGAYSAAYDYDRTIDPYPFASALPAIAMNNHHHLHGARHLTMSSGRVLLERFRKIRAFSEGPYTDLLTESLSGRRKDQIIRTLGYLTGLDMHNRTDFRITPQEFATKRFAADGKVLSMLDGRLLFDKPTQAPRVEVKLDAIEETFINKMQEAALRGWIPSIFASEAYRGIQPYAAEGDWAWDVTNSREALEKLLTRNPMLRVVDMSGYYDLTCPPPRQANVWAGVAEKTGTSSRLNYDFDSAMDGKRPKIDVIMGPYGHQFGYDKVGRDMLGLLLRSLGFLSRYRDPGSYRF